MLASALNRCHRLAVRFVAGLLAIVLAFVIGTISAAAQDHAASDPRIQTLPYDAGRVYELPVSPGYASIVEFEPDELVDSVVLGDGDGWQVTLTSEANRLVIKPAAGAMTTNLIVVSSKRRYLFLLSPSRMGRDIHALRFSFGEDAQIAEAGVPARYRFRGDRSLIPKDMADNGGTTTINWPSQTALPAVFAFDRDGKEMLVRSRATGAGYIIQGIHDRYVFRLGDSMAIARRDIGKRPR